MKKLFLCMLLTALLLTLTVSAKPVELENNYVKEGDFILASMTGTKNLLGDLANTTPVEEACYWLSDYASELNLKYVSFLGNMSSGANYTYANFVASGKGTISDLYAMTENDVEWQRDFIALKNAAKVLPSSGIPYGVSIGMNDYCAAGFDRRNHVQTTFEYDDFFGDAETEKELYDINNYAYVFKDGVQSYIVYQLEAFPQKKVIDWFNKTQAKHIDKRAIVFTTSFLDSNGEMYTQHDWSVYPTSSQWLQVYNKYNTTLKSNMLNTDSPRDGDQLWKDAFADWDNILLIVSANATVGRNIVTKTMKNNNGYDVLAVVANYDVGVLQDSFTCPLLFKISKDNKTIDMRYVVPGYNTDGGYIEESKTVVTLGNVKTLVEGYCRGDVNGDGEISLKDVTILRRCLAGGYGIEIVEEYADVNGDGAIDLKDVTTLRRYIVGGYGIELN